MPEHPPHCTGGRLNLQGHKALRRSSFTLLLRNLLMSRETMLVGALCRADKQLAQQPKASCALLTDNQYLSCVIHAVWIFCTVLARSAATELYATALPLA
jgi:hypothetical protein